MRNVKHELVKKLVILENSGHFPFIEAHDKFVAAVSDWIASLPV
jgi:pimeloyl-ACP methyl ester carboxylesterase